MESDAGEARLSPLKIVRSSIWALIGQAANALALLIPIPLLVRYLGAERYGAWAIANVVIGYLVVTDFGMTVAARRFGAIAHVRRDEAEEARVVGSASVIVVAITGMVTAVVAIFAAPLLHWMIRLPDAVAREAVLALRVLAATYLVRSVTAVIAAPQIVRLHLATNATIITIFAAAQVTAIVIVLRMGSGMGRVAEAMLIVAGAALVAHLSASARFLPPLLRPRFDGHLFRELAAFGAPMALSYLASAFLSQSEKVILARYVTPAVVGEYAVAFTIASGFLIPAMALGQSLVPSFTHAHSGADPGKLRVLYRTSVRWTALLAGAAALIAVVIAPALFRLLFGAGFGQATVVPFLILMAGAAINLMGTIPYMLLQAVGRTGFIARCHLIELPLYLIIAVLLVARFGAIGAAAAWTLRVSADALLLAWGASASVTAGVRR